MTSQVREIPVCEGKGEILCEFVDDDHVVLAELRSDNPQERKLTVIDLESGQRVLRPLPADVATVHLSSDGRSCATLRQQIDSGVVRQELAVMDVATGQWATIVHANEMPHFGVKEVVANTRPFVSFSFLRHSADWLLCKVSSVEATPAARDLINARTGVRVHLSKQDGEHLDDNAAFSKDASRLFTSSWSSGPTGESDGHHRALRVYRLENDRMEFVTSLAFDDCREPMWLDNHRLLYCRRTQLKLFGDRGELWTWDVDTGEQRLFFAGTDPSTTH